MKKLPVLQMRQQNKKRQKTFKQTKKLRKHNFVSLIQFKSVSHSSKIMLGLGKIPGY